MRRFEQEEGVAEVLRELGQELRKARIGSALSQSELSGASGVDQGTISRLERGLAPGLRFATYGRLMEIVGGGDRRAARVASILDEFFATHRPPWELAPPPEGPMTPAQWFGREAKANRP
jgi:transcriptional regulator with XRE-family HTH domain